MSFKDQLKQDQAVFFNPNEFGENATLTTLEGIDYSVVIVKTGQTDLVLADPGAVDMDTFEIPVSVSYELAPGCKITDEKGVVWFAQPGIRSDFISWTVPVISNRRVKG